ncbi:hypothetical protein ACFLS7_05665 [Bacteroidota bacterium]
MARSTTIKGKVYKFVHKEDVFIKTNLVGRGSSHEWLEITDDGTILVKGSHLKGYAWDGCSPKVNFIDLIIGTPDGRFDVETDKQITYYASMIHDALYQYKEEIKISRKEVDIIFKLNLKKADFVLSGIYYFFVRCLGGCYGKWATKETMKNIVITEHSWHSTAK